MTWTSHDEPLDTTILPMCLPSRMYRNPAVTSVRGKTFIGAMGLMLPLASSSKVCLRSLEASVVFVDVVKGGCMPRHDTIRNALMTDIEGSERDICSKKPSAVCTLRSA